MDILTITFMLTVISCLFIYFLSFNNNENSSIAYATYGNYPIIGHAFSFARDRTKFLMNCRQRYGSCFKIRLLNQRFIMVLSAPDWTSIIRNPSFYLPSIDIAAQIFDVSSSFSGMYLILISLDCE
jgi:hypothetical protein